MTERLTEELAVFDAITDLSEAKRCLKITYLKYANCHAAGRIFMAASIVELVIIIALAIP